MSNKSTASKCSRCGDPYIVSQLFGYASLCPMCVMEEQAEKEGNAIGVCPTCEGLGKVFHKNK
jgi:hypothetical protein